MNLYCVDFPDANCGFFVVTTSRGKAKSIVAGWMGSFDPEAFTKLRVSTIAKGVDSVEAIIVDKDHPLYPLVLKYGRSYECEGM